MGERKGNTYTEVLGNLARGEDRVDSVLEGEGDHGKVWEKG